MHIHIGYLSFKTDLQMDPMRRRVLGRAMPKLGKERRLPKEVIFMNRQRMKFRVSRIFSLLTLLVDDKRWLETHIWHAKRMKMENMWGYRLVRTTFITKSI